MALLSCQLVKKSPPLAEQEDIYAPIRHEDFVYALSEIDSIVDISEEKLLKIYTLATSTATRKFVPNLHHHDLSLISPFKGLSHGFIEVIDELHNLAI